MAERELTNDKKMSTEKNKTSEKILIEEYKVTQEAISHYESMIWTIGSIFTAIVVGILGLVGDINNPSSLIIPIIVSIWFYVLWLLFEVRYRQINLSKFRRLWEIEKMIGMKQNLNVHNDDKKRRFKPRGHLLIISACVGFPTTLIILFIVLLLT
jgi:hypothetical protein